MGEKNMDRKTFLKSLAGLFGAIPAAAATIKKDLENTEPEPEFDGVNDFKLIDWEIEVPKSEFDGSCDKEYYTFDDNNQLVRYEMTQLTGDFTVQKIGTPPVYLTNEHGVKYQADMDGVIIDDKK